MVNSKMRILVTGGAGFIGSNFIRYLLKQSGFDGVIVNLDALTYAGNLRNLTDIAKEYEGKSYFFEHGDICEYSTVKKIFSHYDINCVVHFAAESHVDRSIVGPEAFIKTNVNGTFVLLDVAKNRLKENKDFFRFHHVSTEEVYGSLGDTGYFYETTPYDPHSPYSASKAASDHLVRAYFHTYALPVTVSNCSNNYGPYQFPEKLIPLMILDSHEERSKNPVCFFNQLHFFLQIDIPIFFPGQNNVEFSVLAHFFLHVKRHSQRNVYYRAFIFYHPRPIPADVGGIN